jgi:hypothetical protein
MSGVSQEATYLNKLSRSCYQEQEMVVSSPRSDTYNRLIDLYFECREPNWGGEAESCVNGTVLGLAEQFIRSLPKCTQMPDISPEPDGSLYFEWFQQPRRIMSLSIDAQGLVSWAALYGREDPRGSFRFAGNDIPETVLSLIKKVSG